MGKNSYGFLKNHIYCAIFFIYIQDIDFFIEARYNGLETAYGKIYLSVKEKRANEGN